MVAICEITSLILRQVHSRSVTINGFVYAPIHICNFPALTVCFKFIFPIVTHFIISRLYNLDYHTHNKTDHRITNFLCRFFSISSQVIFHSDTIILIQRRMEQDIHVMSGTNARNQHPVIHLTDNSLSLPNLWYRWWNPFPCNVLLLFIFSTDKSL